MKKLALLFLVLSTLASDNLRATSDRQMRVRVTVYWKNGSGSDSWTRRGLSSTGKPLIEGRTVAVDPRLIPYGSTLQIPGYGTARAVDTGSAVIDKSASSGKLAVIDLFFEDRSRALSWEHTNPTILTVVVDRS